MYRLDQNVTKFCFPLFQVEDQEILVVTPSQSLVYPAVEYIRDVIVSSCQAKDSTAPVVIDGTHIYYIDSTMAKVWRTILMSLGC